MVGAVDGGGGRRGVSSINLPHSCNRLQPEAHFSPVSDERETEVRKEGVSPLLYFSTLLLSAEQILMFLFCVQEKAKNIHLFTVLWFRQFDMSDMHRKV